MNFPELASASAEGTFRAETEVLHHVRDTLSALTGGAKSKSAKLVEFLAAFKEERETLNHLLEAERIRVAQLERDNQDLQAKLVFMEQTNKRLYDGFVDHLRAVEADPDIEVSLEQRVEALLLASHVASMFHQRPAVATQKSDAFLRAITETN